MRGRGGREGREGGGEGGQEGGAGEREGGREGERKAERERKREGGRSRDHSIRGYPQEGIYYRPMILVARVRHAIREQVFHT